MHTTEKQNNSTLKIIFDFFKDFLYIYFKFVLYAIFVYIVFYYYDLLFS